MSNKSLRQQEADAIFDRLLAAGMLAPIIFVSNVVLWGALTQDYSHVTQYISELGAREAPYSAYMNWLGIVPFGVFICLYAVGVFRNERTFTDRWLASGTLLFCGFGFVTAGIFVCDEGCRFTDMSYSAIAHNMAALGAFLLAILAVAASLMKKSGWQAATFNILVLLAMLGAFAAMIKLGPTAETIGLAQRAFLAPFCLWLGVSSWRSGRWRRHGLPVRH